MNGLPARVTVVFPIPYHIFLTTMPTMWTSDVGDIEAKVTPSSSF